METPMIDKTSKEEILEIIKEKAESYTPEWRFDRNNPDIGTALAYVYADMHYKTLLQYNKTADKNKESFFNGLHTSMKPAVPAKGYVVFGLVNESVSGVAVPKGSDLVTKELGSNGEKIPVETSAAIYATPVKIQKIYEVYDELDYISLVYEKGRLEEGFKAFKFEEENLQNHILYIAHSSLLSIVTEGTIEIAFLEKRKKSIAASVLEVLINKKLVSILYSSSEDFVQFEKCYIKDNKLCLEKLKNSPPICEREIDGVKSCWIKIVGNNIGELEGFEFNELFLLSKGTSCLPDGIYANGIDIGVGNYFPFGQEFGAYNEVYFSSDEVLKKKGSKVVLSFNMGFVKVPLDNKEKEIVSSWKMIMPVSSVKIEKEYDITIEEVVWEYFNGNGWVRLFKEDQYSNVFTPKENVQEREQIIEFLCPNDIYPVMVNSKESYSIRSRVLKVANAFKVNGQYVAPIISCTSFNYEYHNEGVMPEYINRINNMKSELFKGATVFPSQFGFRPFFKTGNNVPTLYFTMNQPILEGPIRMLFIIENVQYQKRPQLVWEYYKGDRFVELNVADETEHFRKTGLVTFMGMEDAKKIEIFGEESYVIRVQEIKAQYTKYENKVSPVISNFYMNAVGAITINSDLEEWVTFREYYDNPKFKLQRKNLYSWEVWIREVNVGSRDEEMKLKENDCLKYVYNDAGHVEEIWVKWKSVNSFSHAKPNDRHYVIDANEGNISFGDNVHGKVPDVGIDRGIHIIYSIGNGGKSNLSTGAVTSLDISYGFINKVENPKPFTGSFERETITDAMDRTAGQLKHRFRAVTIGDYEKLVKEFVGNIDKVKCFSGKNSEGDKALGHITLVVMQEKGIENKEVFWQLQESLYSYLENKVNANLVALGRLHIVEPVFVCVKVSGDIFVDDYDKVFETKTLVNDELTKFLDPIKGSFNKTGWDIGKMPKRNQIETIIKNIKGVILIRNIVITCTIVKKQSVINVTLEDMKEHPFSLPYSGVHSIKIKID